MQTHTDTDWRAGWSLRRNILHST